MESNDEMIRHGDLGWIGSQLTVDEIVTALNTLAEIVSEGHNADFSALQQEVAEKVYQLWADDETDEDASRE